APPPSSPPSTAAAPPSSHPSSRRHRSPRHHHRRRPRLPPLRRHPSSHPSSSRIYVTVPSPHPHDDPRRRNGSWWPGRILGPDELPASQVMSPKTRTPVKLLGREDASV
ncbi:hypothetical protein EE612_014273, partial [Oryza sativa]